MTKMRINDGKGLAFEFDNGVVLSVQIGRGNYSENYSFPHWEITRDNPLPPSSTAEIACWMNRDEKWLDINGDMVGGYIPIQKVIVLIGCLAALPNPVAKETVQSAINSVIGMPNE